LRFVLDVNVFVSGLLSRSGAPARLLERWLDGDFELVVSEQLLDELERTLAVAKLREHIPPDDAVEFVALVRDLADLAPDPADPPPTRSRDPNDDYLIALAASERARLVSGDTDLLTLEEALPVVSPRAALDLLG
jgi:putative PIN family toxin of toxin-antitoxin system